MADRGVLAEHMARFHQDFDLLLCTHAGATVPCGFTRGGLPIA
jgi:hypothetical protein